jgi:hypothetical protein
VPWCILFWATLGEREGLARRAGLREKLGFGAKLRQFRKILFYYNPFSDIQTPLIRIQI